MIHRLRRFRSAAEPQPNKEGVSIPVRCVGYPKTTHPRRNRNAMQEFIAKHRDEITGVLSGFDRLVFRGTLRSLSHVNGMDTYLAMNKVCGRTSVATCSR